MSVCRCDLQSWSDGLPVSGCCGAGGDIFFRCTYGDGGWPLICGDVLGSPPPSPPALPLPTFPVTLAPPPAPPLAQPAPPPPVPLPLPLTPPPTPPPPLPLLLLPPLPPPPPPPGDWLGGDDDEESPTHVPHMSTVCLGTSESDDCIPYSDLESSIFRPFGTGGEELFVRN